MNQLYTFFESIDLEAIRRFVKERRQEDLHLDFKLVADGRKVQPSDRRTLAKAISSFANSEGGVVVWGVEATRGDDEIDAATRLVPLKDPNASCPSCSLTRGPRPVPSLTVWSMS